MYRNGTGWPIRMERRKQERIKLQRGAPSADFVSQLIAERDHLPANGESVGTAVGAGDVWLVCTAVGDGGCCTVGTAVGAGDVWLVGVHRVS